ncbi:MAG: hypothetical protein B7733_02795 [Myxococcales bacterium FL481]|nr:MAG: hypothetical protein B7733_02795 [Myxococcales bacterium FL481]
MIALRATYLGHAAVIASAESPVSGDAVWVDACRLASQLPPPRPGSHILIVCTHDTRAFVTALFATWVRGHAGALPPDYRRSTTTQLLDRPEIVGLLHDTAAGRAIRVSTDYAPDGSATAEEHAISSETAAVTYHDHHAASPLHRSHGELLARVDAVVDSAVSPAGAAATTLGAASRVALESLILLALRRGAPLLPRLGADDLTLAQICGSHLGQLVTAPAHWHRLLRRDPAVADRIATVVTVPSPAQDPTARHLAAAAWARPEVEDAHAELLSGNTYGLTVRITPTATPAAACRLESHLDALAGGPPRTDTRIVSALDRDVQGRVDRQAWYRHFGRDADGNPLTTTLVWDPAAAEPQEATDEVHLGIHVPTDYAWFEGHFPGYPVMAGAVQLRELVLAGLRRAWPSVTTPRSWSRLKFTQRICPGDRLVLILRRTSGGATIAFEVRRGTVSCSAGRMHPSRDEPTSSP